MQTHILITKPSRPVAGSTLLIALAAMTVLAMIAGLMITRINMNYRAAFHSASWEEAFRASEAGVDLAIASLNLLPTSTSLAWSGWSAPDSSGARTRSYSASTTPPLPSHTGEGNTKLYASLTVNPIVNSGKTWYRIRSVGTAELPGSNSITEEAALKTTSNVKNARSMLRKLSYRTDKTGGVLRLPQTSRTVETVVYPIYAKLFQRSLTTAQNLTMSGGAFTDSFDSSDPLKSTNGLYDVSKRQSNGDVATNISGNTSNLNGNLVYGDAVSNGGIIQKTTGVTGQVANNFQTELPPVAVPNWTIYNSTISTITNVVSLAAGTQAAPARYKVSSINLGSSGALVLTNPTPGQTSYIEIWCTGDMTTTAQATFTISNGVVAKFFVEGNFSISGGGVNNLSSKAANLFLYGVTPADGSSREFKLVGSADFTGVVYAPAYDFKCTGGGNFQGAIVAKTATVSGNAGYHYDEALGIVDSDTSGGFQMASWVEDIR